MLLASLAVAVGIVLVPTGQRLFVRAIGYFQVRRSTAKMLLRTVTPGLATILLSALIDPQLTVLTDDIIAGRVSEAVFRRRIIWISLSRLAGTILEQALFPPAARLVAMIASHV